MAVVAGLDWSCRRIHIRLHFFLDTRTLFENVHAKLYASVELQTLRER